MRRSIPILLPCLVLTALVLLPREGAAEAARRRVPLIGLYAQPSVSLLLPDSGPVTEVYGQAHPTGSIGFSLHPVERFFLALELEGHGWSGTYAPPGGESTELRFLNYWLHIRGRVFIYQSGRWSVGLDALFGVVFGREDSARFRSEGQGVSLGIGPSLQVALGDYLAISINATVGSGWIWYEVESPQSRAGDNDYSLTWPRVLIGVALHGFVVRRVVRPPRPEPEAEEPALADQPPPAGPPSPFDF